jgi:predicted O-linked N-acetylglucosamine transferase (SPINDLY family)
VDIGLDPFPYNGCTTTMEALWMGVPVVTLRGDRYAGHVGESIVMNLGLEQCVADTEESYIAKAVALASDLPRLAAHRGHLRAQLLNSPLCNGLEFVRNLEDIYSMMWESWCQIRKTSPAR